MAGQGRCSAAGLVMAMVMSLCLLCGTASATNYLVGGASGWTLMSYTNWTEGKTFRVGDTLDFVYATIHDVTQVPEANYNSCTKGNNTVYTTGNTTYTLNSTGEVYFICTVDSHCKEGMKLEVDVEAALVNSTAPVPSASNSTVPTSPSGTNTTSPSSGSSPFAIPPNISVMSVMLGLILALFCAS